MRKLVRKAAAGQAIAPATTMQLDSSLLGLKNSLPGLMQPTPMIQQSQQLQPISNQGFFRNLVGSINSGQSLGDSLSSAIGGTKFGQNLSSSFLGTSTGSMVGQAANALSSFIPSTDYSGAKREGLARGLETGYDTAMSAIGMIPGWGQAAQAVMGVGKLANKAFDALGAGTDRQTRADAILGSSFMNLTGVGTVLQLINGFGGKKTNTFEANEEANEQIGSSYSDSLAEFEDAGDISGKKYGLFSRRQMRKANDQIAEAQRQQDIMTDIAQEAEDAQLASNNPLLQNRLQMSRTGGFQATAVGEKGMKLESNLYWARQLLSRMAKAQSTAQLYKDGGKMNIIPTGALHKELHHIDQDNITKKGIPVVTDNNGQIEQQAEIEKEEWILNAKQSNQIEELRDKYNASIDEQEKNQIAIEAGKIIVDELLYNTVDKGKLLKQVS